MSNPYLGEVSIVAGGGGGYLGEVSIAGGVLPPGVIWSFNRVETPISYAVVPGVNFVSVTNTSAARTITLPAPASYGVNVELVIKDDSNNAGVNNITVDGNGATIDGAATFVINKSGGAIVLLCTGTKWLVFASYGMVSSAIPAIGGTPTFLYGIGEDGAVDELVSRTLTRDVYATTYRVRAGVEIYTRNYRIFATQSITVDAGGSINSDGSSQLGSIIAFRQAAGYYGAGTFQTNAPGYSPGGAGNNCQTGRGGNGGAGPAGLGGVAPAPIATTAADGEPSVQPSLWTGKGNNSGGQFICGGAGGNGGGGTGPGAGGGLSGIGGEGGGCCFVAAPLITNNGRISANGGNGGLGGTTATPGLESAGGGGGGGGGKVIMVASRLVGNLPQANGGNGAAGLGAGLAGQNGSAGKIYFYVGTI